MKQQKNKHSGALKVLCVGLMIGIVSASYATDSPIKVRHLVNEQNIVSIQQPKKYLLLPVQDNAPESKVYVVSDNQTASPAMNIRLARESVDYYVPIDLSAYPEKGLAIDIQGLPQNAICWEHIQLSDTYDMNNREKFRPLYHHTPAYGWMNDPNGMFYKDGVYHLYFQHNPYGSTWGNMTWGHSTSRDLVNWEFQGDPLLPDAWGTIFSGSCVVDYENTAGFGRGAVIAFYTSAKSTAWGDSQSQSLAYSLDNGKTFTKYVGNPILTSQERDFRDPKVFWYAPDKHWVMILAVGQEMQIFSSKNLKEWKKESSFGAKQGAHGGVWECPDLVQLPVEGSKEKKWVLICNLNPGGPFGGSAAQYFVGTFDGKKFTNESPTQTKWLDWGKDNYATVTWSNAPDGRCIALGWMSNWQYQAVLPTSQYRGSNTLARDLTLYKENGDYFLKSAPSPEIESLRGEKVSVPSFKVSDTYEINSLLEHNDGAYEIEMTIKNSGASKIVFSLLNAKDEKIYMYYNVPQKQFVMDRSESGLTDFSKDFPAVTVAPVGDTDIIRIRLFIDKSSIEVFGEDGKYVMTNRVFPNAPYNRLQFESVRGNFTVKSLNVYKLK
ncbi:MAG TPA: DUF4980 domain-containing protein [Candidatus Parabacteroides intestinavium]|nr:DUF4980 domain-containing protein [Candidatus Parabacteroides intestinavium]